MKFTFYQKFGEIPLFERAVLISIFFHLSLMGSFYLRKILSGTVSPSTIEIDLTKPFRIGGNPLLKPGGGTLLKEPDRPGIPAFSETPAQTPVKPKEWILPSEQTKELEKPVPQSGTVQSNVPGGEIEGSGEGYKGTGGGFGGGDGEGGGIPLSRFPKLLNRKEILRMLRRLYPEIERQSGREGDVIVDLHLTIDGQVSSVEIAGSSGESFDHVAQIVAKKMRFSPAMVQDSPVAVKIRQSISFKLEDE